MSIHIGILFIYSYVYPYTYIYIHMCMLMYHLSKGVCVCVCVLVACVWLLVYLFVDSFVNVLVYACVLQLFTYVSVRSVFSWI